MEGNVFTIFATLVNFLVLLLILKHFFFNKVTNVIEERNNEVKETIDKANADRAKAEALKLENEKNLQNSKIQGKTIVEDYKVKADKVSSDILQEARQEAESIVDRAKVEAEREKEKAADGIKTQVVDLAVLLSSKALEESVNEEQHRRLIKDFIAKVGI